MPKKHVSREITNKILEAIEGGQLDRDQVILACLKYMSEDDVADMAHVNDFFRCDECGSSNGEHEDNCPENPDPPDDDDEEEDENDA